MTAYNSAKIHYSGALTVDNIAERTNLSNVDGMTVLVLDATDDPVLGSGHAYYKWIKKQNRWLLLSASVKDSISFTSELKPILNGLVEAENHISDNVIWDVYVESSSGDLSLSLGEVSDISGSTISINPAYNGNSLHFTYAYGSISAQLSAVTTPATTEKLGMIKVGDGLTIDVDGALSTIEVESSESISEPTYQLDTSGYVGISYMTKAKHFIKYSHTPYTGTPYLGVSYLKG